LLKEATASGIKLGVGSSSKNAKYILSRLNITDYFDCIVDGNDVLKPKPHPEVFLKGAQHFELSPAECIVFEDAASGIQAAKDGGFLAIAVGNKAIAQKADYYFDDLTQFRLEDYA
jgi:beta-phosphoglucomutase